MPERRETTEQIDWRAKQLHTWLASRKISCVEELQNGHKAKDIIPLIAWRRGALKEEALDDLLSNDERGPSSIRRTLEPVSYTHLTLPTNIAV